MVHDATELAQQGIWNGAAARGWVEMQHLLDRLFAPIEDMLVKAVVDGPGSRVLDVGCGTGGTTLAMARRLGASAHCTGIDISEPMLASARARAAKEDLSVEFVAADAQRHRFDPESFDMIVSRFGVMFFDDFTQAFANLRGATRPGGELRFVSWRSPEENPFMTTAERAAAPLVPIAPRDPDGPGQFGLANEHRIREILERSGWIDITVAPIDVACTLPEAALSRYFTQLGLLGRQLAEMDADAQSQVVELVRPAFDPYVFGSEVRFDAACWMVTAHC